MSNEFKTIRISKDVKEEHNCDDLGLVFKWEENRSKELLEACINLVVKVAQSTSLETPKFDSRETRDNIDSEMLIQIRNLSQIMGYLINSTSWRRGTYELFDEMDIKSKLKHIMIMHEHQMRRWEQNK